MTQYISKGALEEKIDKLANQDFSIIDDLSGRTAYLQAIEDFYKILDSLGAKNVNFNKEVDIKWNECNSVDEGMGCEFATIGIEQFYFITKYFFELGLKAQVSNQK